MLRMEPETGTLSFLCCGSFVSMMRVPRKASRIRKSGETVEAPDAKIGL